MINDYHNLFFNHVTFIGIRIYQEKGTVSTDTCIYKYTALECLCVLTSQYNNLKLSKRLRMLVAVSFIKINITFQYIHVESLVSTIFYT